MLQHRERLLGNQRDTPHRHLYPSSGHALASDGRERGEESVNGNPANLAVTHYPTRDGWCAHLCLGMKEACSPSISQSIVLPNAPRYLVFMKSGFVAESVGTNALCRVLCGKILLVNMLRLNAQHSDPQILATRLKSEYGLLSLC